MKKDSREATTNDSAASGGDIPDCMAWGDPCRHGHQVDGKNLRYINDNACVACAKKAAMNRHYAADRRDLAALDAFNERENGDGWFDDRE